MEHYRAIILVLAADVENYDKLIASIKETWGSMQYPDVKILYYYGYRNNYPRPEPNKVLQVGDDIICGIDESVPNINIKTCLTFKHIYENFSFDYIFRCCAGSYVNAGNLKQFLADKPLSSFYSGFIGQFPPHQNPPITLFASGSGFFLSRDLVKLLIDNPSSFTCHRFDDVALGWFLTSKDITITAGQRQDYPEVLQQNLSNLDPKQYHYHFRHDCGMMYSIHERLYEINK
jgi:hypothetical protein